MDDRATLPDTFSWHPSDPLTVVIADADVAELAEKLAGDEWWRVDNLLSANGIRINVRAEQFWNANPLDPHPDPNEGTAWVGLHWPGYILTCSLRRDTARDLAAGLAGESSVTVPVLFNCEPDEEDWPDQVVVYFRAERSVPARFRDQATIGATSVVQGEDL